MIFVNFKTYKEASGKNAVSLANIIEEVQHTTSVKIFPVVQATDIREVKEKTSLEVWVQKIDPVSFGAHTGAILPEATVEDGASGTFLNHSESKFSSFDELEKAEKRAKEAGLKTLIFASNLEELERVCQFKPDFVAYEPPELIGSATVSVAEAKPEIISQALGIARKFDLPLIVGAGIHSKEDVARSLELGALGIAVSSAVVLAPDPKEKLLELASGFGLGNRR